MDKPTRKNNRIQDYNYSQNGSYFITICTAERTRILSRIIPGNPLPGGQEHVTTELLPFGIIADKYIKDLNSFYSHMTIDKYVIMPDHIHLLLRIEALGTGNPSPTVGTIIGWYKYETTKLFNNLQNTPGQKHFQRSYYDHVIRNQQDYNEILEYIENNPIKWAITREMIQP
jgi:REP element-mobilizing transposase RayT